MELTYLPATMSFNRVLGGGLVLAAPILPRAADSQVSPSEGRDLRRRTFGGQALRSAHKAEPGHPPHKLVLNPPGPECALDLALAIGDWQYGRNRSDIVERALDAIGFNAAYLESFQSES